MDKITKVLVENEIALIGLWLEQTKAKTVLLEDCMKRLISLTNDNPPIRMPKAVAICEQWKTRHGDKVTLVSKEDDTNSYLGFFEKEPNSFFRWDKDYRSMDFGSEDDLVSKRRGDEVW